jgi:hypothetical protein
MTILAYKNLGFADRRLANTVIWHLNPPPNFNMKLPDEIRKCVVYLGNAEQKGSLYQIIYRGTGFFVGVNSKRRPDSLFLFLVTAKHVADKLEYRNFYVRANTVEGKSESLKCDVDRNWCIHPTDKAADVAVLPIGLSPQKFDFKSIPDTMFLDDATSIKQGIGTGDEVYIVGLFVHHQGVSKNIPIVRVGSLAMGLEERIPTKNFGPMEAYLIEARSIGGLSGSPVFVTTRTIPTSTIYLLGLMHGHWNVDSETITDEIASDAGIAAGANVGIAIVTPASKILDILNGDEIKGYCQKVEDDLIAKNSPDPDKK